MVFVKKHFAWVALILLSSGILVKGCQVLQNPGLRMRYVVAHDSRMLPAEIGQRRIALEAFAMELVRAIAKVENVDIRVVDVSSSRLIQGLVEERYHGIMTNLSPTQKNETRFSFSSSFFEYGPEIIVRRDSTVTSFRDLQGKKLGVERTASKLVGAVKEAGVTLVTFSSDYEAILALLAGEVEGVMVYSAETPSLIRGPNRGRLKVGVRLENQEGLRFAVLKGEHKEFIQRLEHGLQQVRLDGTYQALWKRWLSED